MPRIKSTDKLLSLREQQKQIENKIKELERKESAEARKAETHKKIVAGALALEHMQKNPASSFAGKMRELLELYAKPHERSLFGLAPVAPPSAAGQESGAAQAPQLESVSSEG